MYGLIWTLSIPTLRLSPVKLHIGIQSSELCHTHFQVSGRKWERRERENVNVFQLVSLIFLIELSPHAFLPADVNHALSFSIVILFDHCHFTCHSIIYPCRSTIHRCHYVISSFVISSEFPSCSVLFISSQIVSSASLFVMHCLSSFPANTQLLSFADLKT